jgi:omega-6 fatty acid desaturase (delta-12 desaturase)
VRFHELLLTANSLEPTWALLWRIPLLILGWIVVGTGMTRLFIIGHDCGHRAFSKRAWINDLVGHLAMAPIWSSYHGWRIGHNYHHTHTLVRNIDIDWAETMVTREEYLHASWPRRFRTRLFFNSPVGLLTGFLVGLFRRMFMTFYPQVQTTPRGRRQLLISRLALIGVSGGMAVVLGITVGFGGLLKYYVIPIELGMTAGALVTYFHHNGEGALAYDEHAWSPVLGQVASTFDLRYPTWIESLFLNTNFHRVHHLAPQIPYYRMRRATAALAAAFPHMHQERTFSFGYVRRAFQRPFLEPAGDGVYVQR